MDKKLYKRIVKTALISSPIMALYGVTPLYIFNKMSAPFIFWGGIVLMMRVLAFWVINIWIIKLSENGRPAWKRYVLSFLFTTTLHLGITLLRQAAVAADVFIDFPFIAERAFITYPIISMLAINTIILIICDLLLAIQKRENAELEVEQLEVKNLQAQKRILMQQLQPHFLFNTLTALKSLIKENPEEAENYTVKLSEFLRYTIQVNSDYLVRLEDELKFMNDYLQLQKIRFENSLICQTDIPADVNFMKLPAFALQTLVENAIKHNSFTEKKPLHIKIQYNNGSISVWNNRLLSKVESTPGTGLKNLNDRYKMTTGKEIEIRDNKDEFCVTVQLINSDSI